MSAFIGLYQKTVEIFLYLTRMCTCVTKEKIEQFKVTW